MCLSRNGLDYLSFRPGDVMMGPCLSVLVSFLWPLMASLGGARSSRPYKIFLLLWRVPFLPLLSPVLRPWVIDCIACLSVLSFLSLCLLLSCFSLFSDVFGRKWVLACFPSLLCVCGFVLFPLLLRWLPSFFAVTLGVTRACFDWFQYLQGETGR